LSRRKARQRSAKASASSAVRVVLGIVALSRLVLYGGGLYAAIQS
jgi:hypothetical protein